jgi:hypothetical protein
MHDLPGRLDLLDSTRARDNLQAAHSTELYRIAVSAESCFEDFAGIERHGN